MHKQGTDSCGLTVSSGPTVKVPVLFMICSLYIFTVSNQKTCDNPIALIGYNCCP